MGGYSILGGGGNLFQSNFGTKRYLTKLSTFDPVFQKCSISVFQNWHNIHFLLHFHVCCFSNNRYEWISTFLWCIYILSSKSKKYSWYWSKALLNFFAMNYEHCKSQSFLNVFCLKKCYWKWLYVKLPAANKRNCS